ncbi:hypothetical protein WJX84_003310 [Apatococcus fuscideae]|uniref:SET domain-containing protein n=1 Tax=Apatococcus fuscideae TaxID=2026836 RepID=A0AAW1SY55_9CHLO
MQDLAALFDKSAAVLQHSLVGGRYLVAKHHLEAGDVVLQCPVLLTAQLPSWRKRICYACHRMCQARLALRCKGCEQQLAGQAPSETQQRASAAVGAFEVLQDHAAELGKRERLEWLSALTFLRQDSTEDDLLTQAADKADNVYQPLVSALSLPNAAAQMSPQHSLHGPGDPADGMDDGKQQGSGGLLVSESPVLDADNFPRHPRSETSVGRVLFLQASFFNHSCHPNCYVHRNPTGATIIAMQPIAVGQELTISYIDEQLPQAARMLALQRDFFFRCNCSRCSFGLREGSSRRKAKRG